jgi:hypothetical protein
MKYILSGLPQHAHILFSTMKRVALWISGGKTAGVVLLPIQKSALGRSALSPAASVLAPSKQWNTHKGTAQIQEFLVFVHWRDYWRISVGAIVYYTLKTFCLTFACLLVLRNEPLSKHVIFILYC